MMLAGPTDITTMISFNPIELKITSVRTKRICLQDIIAQKNVNLSGLLHPYEPPKMVEIIKNGLVAVTTEELQKDIEQKEKEVKNEETLSELKELLTKKSNEALSYLPPPPTAIAYPSEMNIPIVSYTPYTGGVMDNNTPSKNLFQPIISPIWQNLPHQIISSFPWIGEVHESHPSNTQTINTAQILRAVSDLSHMLAMLRSEVLSAYRKMFTGLRGDIHVNRDVVLKEGENIISAMEIISKAMSKSIADYFRNMMITLLKNGCAYFPIGISGVLSVRVINNTPLPQAMVFDNIVVKSMDYTLSRPRSFTIFAAPRESDVINIPMLVENVDAVDYIINQRNKGVIPVVISSRVKVGPIEQNVVFAEASVPVR